VRTLDRGAEGLSVPSVTEVGERPAGPSRGTPRRGVGGEAVVGVATRERDPSAIAVITVPSNQRLHPTAPGPACAGPSRAVVS